MTCLRLMLPLTRCAVSDLYYIEKNKNANENNQKVIMMVHFALVQMQYKLFPGFIT